MKNDAIVSIIKRIVFDHINPADYKAFIFGSRVSGANRPFSDIDVGIMGSRPIPSKNYIELVHALDDSDIPYRTDVVDFSSVSDSFKKHALTDTIDL